MQNRSTHPLSAILTGLMLSTLTNAQTPLPGTTASKATANDYAKADTWLCRPGRRDACTIDLSTTIVAPDGKLTREAFTANPSAPIDCFYVYPTVSLDATPNSDMAAGPEEMSVISAQFARFASQCRTFAPLYRQVTLGSLRAMTSGGTATADRTLGYNDVVNAWNYYLEHDNQGRGVVLVGHSQGSGVLTQLIAKEIDGKPVQANIVSALLLGTSVAVPKGKDVGGAFKSMPLCHAATQTGCVVTYASFRSTVPPPSNSLFGKVAGEGMVSACTNPAALGGGSGKLHAYLSSASRNNSASEPAPWTTPASKIDTPFVSVPGLVSAQCVANEHGSYLEVTVHGDPKDARVDDIVGDVMTSGKVQANWGLHLIDVNLAMGNLVDIVSQQSKAYLSKRK